MELTARDLEILRMVNRHRFLRSHQIADLVGGSRQQVLRRLQRLYHHGYVDRPLCQLDYFQRGGSRSIVYGLSSRGASHLRRVAGIPFDRLDWTTRNRSVKRIFLQHALMVSDIMVELELECRYRGDVRLLIEHEIPMSSSSSNRSAPFRWQVRTSQNTQITVIPDRVFALERIATEERILCFLEADCGTMPVERTQFGASSISRKVFAYIESWKSRIHTSRFGIKRLRILTVTTTEERCTRIAKLTSALRDGKGIFRHSTLTSSINCDLLLL